MKKYILIDLDFNNAIAKDIKEEVKLIVQSIFKTMAFPPTDNLTSMGITTVNLDEIDDLKKIINGDIKKFYDTIFSKIIKDKLSYTNKTHILEQTAKEMITCLETNISTHFIKHLFSILLIGYTCMKNESSRVQEVKSCHQI